MVSLKFMAENARIIAALIIILLIAAGGSIWVQSGLADELPEDIPERTLEILIPVTETEWWLASWADNQIQCVVLVDHPQLPTPNEVFAACGEDLYEEWRTTPLCELEAKGGSTEVCVGLYVFKAAQRPSERPIIIDLPIPSVWLSITGCQLTAPENICPVIPNMVLTGEEPLPNERITAIHWQIGDEQFSCADAICSFPMPITGLQGEEILFWADSSFGDTTQLFSGQMRVVDAGPSALRPDRNWYVDVLSTQWQGGKIASCAQAWEAFPPVGGPPIWLSTPDELEALASEKPYVFLAGRLIAQGLVNASSCPAGGLLENGSANVCGLEMARQDVDDWQNRFDSAIIEVANETNVPAQLIKNLFAVESQFWPGVLLPDEFGFGQMTEQGADTTLLWNTSFFDEFCPLILEADACAGGYLGLDEEAQAMLRGALATGADSSCEDCPVGIDLNNARFSIDVFAQTLLGNCEQAGRVVRNTTGLSPGAAATYEDLWRFTLVNYNAGPGCLSAALLDAWRLDRSLDWQSVSNRLEPECPNTVAYVRQIALESVALVDPTPTPTATPTATPVAAPSPTATTIGVPYPAPVTPPYP